MTPSAWCSAASVSGTPGYTRRSRAIDSLRAASVTTSRSRTAGSCSCSPFSMESAMWWSVRPAQSIGPGPRPVTASNASSNARAPCPPAWISVPSTSQRTSSTARESGIESSCSDHVRADPRRLARPLVLGAPDRPAPRPRTRRGGPGPPFRGHQGRARGVRGHDRPRARRRGRRGARAALARRPGGPGGGRATAAEGGRLPVRARARGGPVLQRAARGRRGAGAHPRGRPAGRRPGPLPLAGPGGHRAQHVRRALAGGRALGGRPVEAAGAEVAGRALTRAAGRAASGVGHRRQRPPAQPRLVTARGAHALRTGAAQRLDHLVVRADVAEHPLHEPRAALRLQLEQLAEAGSEVILAELAALQPADALDRARLAPEQALDRLRVQALVLAESPERLEDVRCQHAAEVDQQALHERAISRAFSASIGTPRSNSARYWSSELPDWKRL